VIAFGPLITMPRSAEAASTKYSQQTVWINSGGGVQTDGSDGIKLEFNGKYSGGDEIYFANTTQYCCSGVSGVQLNIGGQLYGNAGAASGGSALAFDSLTIGELTGSAINNDVADGTTGDGSAVLTYTKDIGGLQYDLIRRIDYTAPNLYYTETFTINIPVGNTAMVKLYKGGDTAPGNSDSGRALYLPTPVKSVMSIEPSSGIVLGMREIAAESNMSTFEGAVAIRYSDPFATVRAGGNLVAPDGSSFGALNTTHDVGMYIQYDIGTADGTFTEENETFVAFQAVNLDAAWSSARVSSIGTLNITLTNQMFGTQSGLGYTFTIPSPLTIGDVDNGCGDSFNGSVSVVGNVITVSGVDMPELTSCVVTVTVGRPTAGSTSIGSGNVSGLTGAYLVNNVGSSTVTFTAASPTFTPRPSRTRTPTSTSSPTFTSSPTATNTATATNTFTPTNTMTPTPHPFAIKDVAVGASFTLAVLHNGTLVTWGFNRAGQASLPRWMATKLVDQVEVGSNYAMALGTDGRVYGWGANDFGQMRIPTTATSRVRSISASLGHIMALKTNGDLVIWGRDDFKQTRAPLAARKGLTAVGAGHSHSLAVKGGKVIAWGRNTWGQTSVPKNLANVVAVAGGFDHSLALRSNGTVVCWGRNNEGQCNLPRDMKDVIAISAGIGYSLALGRDGEVYAWGRSNFGQATIPAGLSKAGAISAGYVNSVIGLRDASVVAFGNASLGALVSRTPTVTVRRSR
ncbi:MAG: RCC1 domain-containing protein, partial [Roseiflexaceae bacterium]